ncbi:MAG TPA: DUF6249 domain-containing protein [Pseudomonadales bacterium]|nr:DUF6249 domain-containing protein [Pseudomonadales bacterium]
MTNFMEAMIPITLFATPGIVAAIWLWLRYRQRRDMMNLVGSLAERDQTLPTDLAAILAAGVEPTAERDMRRGVLLIGIALALAAFGLIDGDVRDMLAAAVFPAIIGAAYLLFWYRGHDAAA